MKYYKILIMFLICNLIMLLPTILYKIAGIAPYYKSEKSIVYRIYILLSLLNCLHAGFLIPILSLIAISVIWVIYMGYKNKDFNKKRTVILLVLALCNFIACIWSVEYCSVFGGV